MSVRIVCEGMLLLAYIESYPYNGRVGVLAGVCASCIRAISISCLFKKD